MLVVRRHSLLHRGKQLRKLRLLRLGQHRVSLLLRHAPALDARRCTPLCRLHGCRVLRIARVAEGRQIGKLTLPVRFHLLVHAREYRVDLFLL